MASSEGEHLFRNIFCFKGRWLESRLDHRILSRRIGSFSNLIVRQETSSINERLRVFGKCQRESRATQPLILERGVAAEISEWNGT